MKRTSPWAAVPALLCWLLPPGLRAETPLPTPFPEARYQQMSARSPFAIATASAAATPAATPGFASQLYVDGVAHVGKTDFVAIKSRDPTQQSVIFLEVGKTNPDGLKVERVIWSNTLGKSTVDVSKAGERATLEFDEQNLKNGMASAAPPGEPGMPMPNMPVPGRPMNFPMPNGQPPYNRFFPPQPGQPGQPGVPGMNLPQSVINMQRRRMRGIIQSGQQ
jgi:hypothetical protein